MTDTYLEHYGVKGMKWGKRKAEDGPSKSQLIKADRKAAQSELGTRNKELNDALKEWKVANRERRRTKRNSEERAAADEKFKQVDKKVDDADNAYAQTYYRATQKTTGEHVREWAGLAAIFTASSAVAFGPTLIRSAASSAATRRGAAAAASALADSRGLTSYRTIALAFDAASNTWK